MATPSIQSDEMSVGSNQADNRCAVCHQVRDYELTPIAVLANDPDLKGGVCRELFTVDKTCYMVYSEMLYRQSPNNPRNKYPTGRPPTETEKLTDAIKELTRVLSQQNTRSTKKRAKS